MALYTSVQSGPFDVASTWDLNAVPGDGDQFHINYGHNVAVTGDIRPTNGYDYGNIYGKLHIQGSGCYLRMNGSLHVRNDANYGQPFVEGQNSAGYFRMDPGSTLEIRGTNDDQHRLYIYTSNHRWVTCEIIGDHPGPETTLSSDADNHATALSFTDASKFRPGDWITVYMPERSGESWTRYRSDESFWINDISSNTVYFRHFVSPEATIQNVRDNTAMVDDANVFNANTKVIFGTGNNRNVKTIISLSKNSNQIVFDSNITGNVIGEKIFQTGVEKQHFSGDQVKKLAATLVANSNAGSNTITVNNTNGFQVGDLILIPNNDTDYSSANGWNYIQDYTITNINTSTNVITISGGYYNPTQTTLQYDVKADVGGIVVNMSRNTKIKPPDGATGQNSFIYSNNDGNTNAYYTRWKFKNVEINLGPNSKSQWHSTVSLNGHASYDLNSYGQYVSEFDGNVIYPSNRSIAYYGYHHYRAHQLTTRNNVLYNHGHRSIFHYDFNNHHAYYSNIICRGNDWLFMQGFAREGYEEFSYNYLTRNANGLYFYNSYGVDTRCYQNYILFTTSRPFIHVYGNDRTNFQKCYFDYYYQWPSYHHSGNFTTLNCHVGNGWDVTGGPKPGISRRWGDRIDIARSSQADVGKSFNYNSMTHINPNFQNGTAYIFNNGAFKYWDETERAWRIMVDPENALLGFLATVLVPANSQLFVSADVKSYSNLTNYPFLFVQAISDSGRGHALRKVLGTELSSINDASEITEATGFRATNAFTSASKSGYENKTLVIPGFPFYYYAAVGVLINNGSSGNAFRGWWEKDLDINIEKPTGLANNLDKSFNKKKTGIAKTVQPRKTIWGGG